MLKFDSAAAFNSNENIEKLNYEKLFKNCVHKNTEMTNLTLNILLCNQKFINFIKNIIIFWLKIDTLT